MIIPKKIIDNTDITLARFLNEVLKAQPDTKLDIATAFFNIKAYGMIEENLDGISHFRLLLGKAPEISSDTTLGEELLKIIKEEVEEFDLSQDNELLVKKFIEFLRRDNVEIRLYDKGFFHGKAYIFDKLVIIGSSNFTSSGLTYNTELNSVSLEAEAKYTKEEWFNKFWEEAGDFKDALIKMLEESRFGSKEYTPYEVFVKILYELQKDDLEFIFGKDEKIREELAQSRVNLAEFQEDAVKRLLKKLEKYQGILVADTVGLGKTWIAKKVIEEFGFYKRKKFLIVCPAQLREMWRDEIKDLILAESIVSQEELANDDYLDKAKKAVGGSLKDISLIVVDESHNFRNPLSNRWENFFQLIEKINVENKKRPYILFLTATPINNTIWDLYWQIMLLTYMNRGAFIKEGISDILKFFKDVDKREDPSYLNDILNEISIRRTRDYIKRNYPDAEIKGKKIIFPERELDNINYELDKAYEGMYKEISDIITNKLSMAYYRLLKYKKVEKLSAEEEMALGRMIALEGIFRTILLKRLESSVEAFRKSVGNHIKFLNHLLDLLKEGKLLTKEYFNKYVVNMGEESFEDIREQLADIKIEDYRIDDLITDIGNDIELLNSVLDRISGITAEKDAKINVLKKNILELAKKGQIVLFTYFIDTLDYIFDNIVSNKEFAHLKIEKISSKVPEKKRGKIVKRFLNKEINIIMSTDVLSEGLNLQSAQFCINYDLHWNPTRMIQRAGRIDRIGSPFERIYVYNFFPEKELEELLRLVQILQNKIRNIDESVGLDETVLGEEVHPKVFGIMRRIKDKDKSIFDELEINIFGGGEKFYQPLREYLKAKTLEEIRKLPDGIHSGLERKKIKGIFFYYQYSEDFHFWYLYDVVTNRILKNKSEIMDFISCPPEEKRVIPDFFEKVYEINDIILDEIESLYREIEQRSLVETGISEIARDSSMKFIKSLINEAEIQIDNYLLEFPEDKEVEQEWEEVRNKLLAINLTKKRLREVRRIWHIYKNRHKNWKVLIKEIKDFVSEIPSREKEIIEPFDMAKLRLIAIDFIS